ncbi:hypothetical protein QQZ08_006231 [Neonectria magnoliae]|uniref:Uncharacterized protein n=1 Tax=Neonectria magnoliae TaxID=2732573 RepID=A0ABR1I2L5_9HYPO
MVGLQVLGIHLAVPLIALLSASLPFDASAGRFVQPEVGKSLIPALALGYIFPTILMLAPLTNTGHWEEWAIVVPFLLPALMVTLPPVLKLWKSTKNTTLTPYLDRYKPSDVAILQFAYGFAFAIQATAHWVTLWYACIHSKTSLPAFSDLFISEGSDEALREFLSLGISDVFLTALAIVIYNLYSVWDLRRAGYITNRDTFWAVLSIVVGQVVVGPGATWAGLWSWRESVLSSVSKTE